MRNKALLVIDMQKGDDYTYSHIYKRERLVKNISKLIDAFHKKKQKIIELKIWVKKSPKTVILKKCPKCGIENTKYAEVMDELKDKKYDKKIKKENYSGFFRTDLDAYLKKNKIKELYLTGIHTGCCILFTGADAFYRGYDTYIVADAVSSVSDKKGIKNKIDKFRDLIGDAISTSALIKKL